MREVEALRRQYREMAQRQAGIGRGPSLVTQAEVANAHADADVERLPEMVITNGDIQAPGGGWYYTVDLDAIDSLPIG